MPKIRFKHSDGILKVLALMPEEVKKRVNRERVEEALSGLTRREKRSLALRFGLEDGEARTYDEIGEELGMTPMGAMKLFKRSCKKVIDRMQKLD